MELLLTTLPHTFYLKHRVIHEHHSWTSSSNADMFMLCAMTVSIKRSIRCKYRCCRWVHLQENTTPRDRMYSTYLFSSIDSRPTAMIGANRIEVFPNLGRAELHLPTCTISTLLYENRTYCYTFTMLFCTSWGVEHCSFNFILAD